MAKRQTSSPGIAAEPVSFSCNPVGMFTALRKYFLYNGAVDLMVVQDRIPWKSVVEKVTGVLCKLRGEKITKRWETKKAK